MWWKRSGSLRRDMKSSKHQAPSSREASSTKHQTAAWSKLGGWCFSGAWRLVLGAFLTLPALALDIQFPPETGAFKQDRGAEIANGQCLICHSVEYVSIQPPMPRPFWKSSVQKMQQKYGAPIPEEQIEPLVDYLVKNYGLTTNGAASSASAQMPNSTAATDGPRLAAQYGCFGCHHNQVKTVGPAYRDIAAKYRTDSDAHSKIEQQIHKGGSGKWGPIIMPPFPQIN